MNQTPQRTAFQNIEPQTAKKQLSLKLDNKKSITSEVPKPPSRQEGEKQALEANARLNGYAKQAADLAMQYKQAIDDKTLPINKSIIAKDAERSLIANFVDLGVRMNNDVTEIDKDGMGSMGLLSLLLRTTFLQRDRMNELEYANEQLRKSIGALESKVKALAEVDNETTSV